MLLLFLDIKDDAVNAVFSMFVSELEISIFPEHTGAPSSVLPKMMKADAALFFAERSK
jgi:hypothetical protein